MGTEEGRIHVGNLEYTSQYVGTYSGHSMAVYAVRWNPYHPRVFLSASAGAYQWKWCSDRLSAARAMNMTAARNARER